jgi:hypothetical protein
MGSPYSERLSVDSLLPKVNIASVAVIPRRSRKASSLKRAESNSPTTSSPISTIILFGQLDPNVASSATFRPQRVPQLTCSADIKLNAGVSLQRLANLLALIAPDIAQRPEISSRANHRTMILRSAALFDKKGNGKAINK